MGHFTRIRLEKFKETGNFFQLFGAIPAMMTDYWIQTVTMAIEYNDENKNKREQSPTKEEAHPIIIAFQAMELYRSGQWDKEKAMRVVKEALEEYQNPKCGQNWQSKPISFPALPGVKVHVRIEDVDLLNKLFS
jgi:hypothetical protein